MKMALHYQIVMKITYINSLQFVLSLTNLGIGNGGRSGGGTSISLEIFSASDPPSELLIPLAPDVPIIGTPSIMFPPFVKPLKIKCSIDNSIKVQFESFSKEYRQFHP